MSNKKVQEFLKGKEEEKDNQEIINRYKILSHYNLGEKVYLEGEGNEAEYPLKDFDSYGKTRMFKYDCNISDEDFERVCAIYYQEVGSSEKMGLNDGAEGVLSSCATILLIIGIIVFIVLLSAAIDNHDFNWTLFGIGTGVALVSLMEFAFAKVLVNISRKLNKLG